VSRAGLGAIARRTTATWDDGLVSGLGGPLTLVWTVVVSRLLLPLLGLQGELAGFAPKAMRTAIFVAFFWFVMRVVAVLADVVAGSPWAQARPASRSLVPLGARILQVGVLAMATVGVLADLGYPVASLVAGLGIGGLALALAGQKTVENLFGAFSIGVDQPFRVGDTIAVEGVTGQVESIGLRSTRIRTAERSLVTIPNGKLADMRIESLAPRDRLRFAQAVGLALATKSAQARTALAGMEGVLRAQPKLHPDGLVVRLRAFTERALEVEVQAYFQTTDAAEFQTIRQEVLLGLIEAVERAGSELAGDPRRV
jgi:MscS family membrane protein